MLVKAKTLKGYKLESLDGEIGEVEEFFFDDPERVKQFETHCSRI